MILVCYCFHHSPNPVLIRLNPVHQNAQSIPSHLTALFVEIKWFKSEIRHSKLLRQECNGKGVLHPSQKTYQLTIL